MKTDHFTLLTCSPIIVQDNKKEINITWIFFKKLAHAYFERRIFSKSFGGKFRQIRILLTEKLMHEY